MPGLNGPFTTKYATPTPGYVGCGAYLFNDVFFSFTPPVTGLYSFNTCSPVSPLGYDQNAATNLSVHAGTGGGCSTLTAVGGCDTPCSSANLPMGGGLSKVAAINMTGGTPYLIRVGDDAPQFNGKFWLTVNGPPSNDDCSAAVPLPVNGQVAGDNSTASSAPNNPAPTCVASASRDVWYTYVYPGPATCAATTTLSLCGTASNMDSVLSVYTGACGNLTSVACNDDGCLPASHESVLSFTPTIGVTYFVSVSRSARAARARRSR